MHSGRRPHVWWFDVRPGPAVLQLTRQWPQHLSQAPTLAQLLQRCPTVLLAVDTHAFPALLDQLSPRKPLPECPQLTS